MWFYRLRRAYRMAIAAAALFVIAMIVSSEHVHLNVLGDFVVGALVVAIIYCSWGSDAPKG